MNETTCVYCKKLIKRYATDPPNRWYHSQTSLVECHLTASPVSENLSPYLSILKGETSDE